MTKQDFAKETSRARLRYENVERKLNNVLENQDIIIQQLLFVLDYLIGDDEKREEIKRNLCSLPKMPNEERRTMQ